MRMSIHTDAFRPRAGIRGQLERWTAGACPGCRTWAFSIRGVRGVLCLLTDGLRSIQRAGNSPDEAARQALLAWGHAESRLGTFDGMQEAVPGPHPAVLEVVGCE